ncbi:MAG: PD-(D/E)XK nuclease family protein, partial [Actinobacteria bacterium]|nr:PD-(D/E)XK nuclease family protein [Actinomycetota bacterium]
GTKLQLPVYALAARRAHGRTDTPVHAYYWFITRKAKYRDIGYVVDNEVMARFDHIVATVLDGLETGTFPARPSGESYEFYVSCEYCDPDHLGTAARRREWERKRDDPALRAYRELAEPESLLEPTHG